MPRSATRTRKARPEPKPEPTEEELAAALRKYNADYLLCRDLKHVWRVVGYFRDAFGDYRRRLACGRCPMERVDHLNEWGGRLGPPKYKRPKDYRLGVIENDDIRAESIRRAKVFASEKSMMTHTFTGNGSKKKNGNGHAKPRATKTYSVRHTPKRRVGASR